MQTVIRRKTKPKQQHRNENKLTQEDVLLSEYVSTLMKVIAKYTFDGIQSLKIDLEPNRIILTGFCDSYYIKQLAQQAILDMVIDMEIVNDIVVI